MVLLQHKLSVKLSQRQILTPGLVQMVSVLALNKLELKDMITAEMVENPVLEELEESVPLLDEVGRKEEDRERAAAASNEENPATAAEKKDPSARSARSRCPDGPECRQRSAGPGFGRAQVRWRSCRLNHDVGGRLSAGIEHSGD